MAAAKVFLPLLHPRGCHTVLFVDLVHRRHSRIRLLVASLHRNQHGTSGPMKGSPQGGVLESVPY